MSEQPAPRASRASRATGGAGGGDPVPPARVGRWEVDGDGHTVRAVLDAGRGRMWRVRAVGCTRVPGAPTADCLVFDAGTLLRRVWGVPPDWATLDDAALLALAESPPGRAEHPLAAGSPHPTGA